MRWGSEGEKDPEVTPRRKLFVEYLMLGTMRTLGFKDINKTQPWKPGEERQTGGGKCNKENGTTVERGKRGPGLDSNKEKTQKNSKTVTVREFYYF